MKTIYNKDDIQIAEFPSHSRTIQFKEYKKFVSIPAGYVIIYKFFGIKSGIVISKNLDNILNFNNVLICLNGYQPRSIEEYFSWYWTSRFSYFSPHSMIFVDYFRICMGNTTWFHRSLNFLFKTNKEKIIDWIKNDRIHINQCVFCQEFANKHANIS